MLKRHLDKHLDNIIRIGKAYKDADIMQPNWLGVECWHDHDGLNGSFLSYATLNL